MEFEMFLLVELIVSISCHTMTLYLYFVYHNLSYGYYLNSKIFKDLHWKIGNLFILPNMNFQVTGEKYNRYSMNTKFCLKPCTNKEKRKNMNLWSISIKTEWTQPIHWCFLFFYKPVTFKWRWRSQKLYSFD